MFIPPKLASEVLTHSHVVLSRGTDIRLRISDHGLGCVGATEGSLEVKLPTMWTNGKAEVEGVREEKRRDEPRREEKRRDEKRREETRRDEKRRHEKRRETLCFSTDLWLRRVKK